MSDKDEIINAVMNASLIKEAKASCELDDCTQCGTIEPEVTTEKENVDKLQSNKFKRKMKGGK